ncbi:MAG: hypothetical protein EOR16_30735 [Mesorhizobium sp.]|uniref:amidohydrolase family protein n=1 Tax=Mesorhizobium sp. TaxID=1871066 RepID=UPI000FE60473|nr:amidohydrolase family protein [Mesorhizobium sp.]RWI50266.1 MAG: hypothetical protein EOR16_30735 [Mesorhizobium sp.]
MVAGYLIKGASIVTMDDAIGDLNRGDILVRGDRIVNVAASIDASDVEVIDGTGMIALPGIIDAHNILWQTVLRGCLPDLWLNIYYTYVHPLRARFRPEDNYTATFVGAHEMLSYGTTTVLDYCHNIRTPEHADASVAALRDSGIRHVFAYAFLGHRPDGFTSLDKRMDDAERVFRAYHDPASLTTVQFGIETPGAPDVAREISFARGLGALSSIHIMQSGQITELQKQGLLGPDIPAIHANYITNDELEMMAEVGMPICFTPSADVQGAPADVVRRAMTRGVDVVFGCDLPCHVASDPIGQLRIMYNIQGYMDGAIERTFGVVSGKRPIPRPGLPLLRPRDLIRIATITAARVLGLSEFIGSLTPGKKADIVLIRKGIFGDSVDDDHCAHVLLQTSPREIDTVMVDGRIRLRGGLSRDFDPTRAGEMIATSRAHIFAGS